MAPTKFPTKRLRQEPPKPLAECTEIAIYVIAIANFHRRPEIAAISGTLFKQETLRFTIRDAGKFGEKPKQGDVGAWR